MFHSHWEMEVFAREIQDLRRREAERERAIAAVCRIGRRNAFAAVGGRITGVWRAAFSGRPESRIGEVTRGAVGAPNLGLQAVRESAAPSRPRVNPLTAPYAAMVVVARGPAATPAAQPSRVGDR